MKQDNSRKTALVTGASSGIGSELARLLAKRGYDVVLVARREDRLKALAAEIEKTHGVTAEVLACDLSKDGAAADLHRRVAQKGLSIDVLVNNAGFGMKGEFAEADPRRVDEMIRLNVGALTSLTRLFGADMKAGGSGHILQVASVGAFQPCPYFAAYAATKAYVMSFGEAVGFELARYGVKVTTVYPGMTATEFFEVSQFKPKKILEGAAMTPLEVAKQALNALFAGRASVVTGWTNKANALLVGLVPRSLAKTVVGSILRKL